MTTVEASATSSRIVGPDGLTNKERRLAKQAEKRKREEGGAAVAVEEAPQAAADVVAPAETADDDEAEAVVTTEDAEEQAEEDVEALSHKERRKRRKLEKQGKLLPDGSKTGTTATTTPNEPNRSPYAVWIGNLSFMTNPQRLQQWLEEKGLSGISRVHMPKGGKKFEQNKGFAYVDLPSAEAVKQAVALSEINLDGRKLLIKSANDFAGRPAIDPASAALAQASNNLGATAPAGFGEEVTTSSSTTSAHARIQAGESAAGKTGLTKTAQKLLRNQKHAPGPTLFIGNLSFNSTQEGVLELFERSAKAREEWSKSAKEKRREEKREERRIKNGEEAAARKRAKKESQEPKGESDSDDDDDEQEDVDDVSSSDSSDSEDEEEATLPTQVKDANGKTTTTQVPRGAGIRKVRMGTFEDTGKCKGFAFVDFHTPTYSTASLIDPRNYRLDGRELTIQFAGADAVRRGAPKSAIRDGTAARGGRGGGRGGRGGGDFAPRGPPRAGGSYEEYKKGPPREKRVWGAEGDDSVAAEGGRASAPAPVVLPVSDNPNHKETQAERKARRERDGKASKDTRRATPGAALANAQRGKTAIDLSGEAGKKVTFD